MSKRSGRGLRKPQHAPESSSLVSQEAAGFGFEPEMDAEKLPERYSERLKSGEDVGVRAPVSLYPQTPDDRWVRFLGDIADLRQDKRSKRAA